jgi:phosphatidate cytidylyltransferase
MSQPITRFGFLTSPDFILRAVSALVLAAAVLVIAWLGGWPHRALWVLAAVLVMLEWQRMVKGASPLWLLAGLAYAAAAAFAPIVLRVDGQWGFQALLWLFAVVWATDVLAYLIGRSVGGPKLWPRVSPKKTWSGFVGGVSCGAAVGTCVALAFNVPALWPVAVVSLMAALATQGGDLLESGLKRAFNVKDSGAIIPGHGGVMDRLDGFIVAGLLVALLGIGRGGVEAAATGVLVW